jgi:hypothetical protein
MKMNASVEIPLSLLIVANTVTVRVKDPFKITSAVLCPNFIVLLKQQSSKEVNWDRFAVLQFEQIFEEELRLLWKTSYRQIWRRFFPSRPTNFFLGFTFPPPPGGTAILPEYIGTLLRILLSSNSAVLINIITGVSRPHFDFVVFWGFINFYVD